jgi:di/tripeptidase
MDRDVLMQEGVAEKFMRYVRVNTESCDEAETTPSTSVSGILPICLLAS